MKYRKYRKKSRKHRKYPYHKSPRAKAFIKLMFELFMDNTNFAITIGIAVIVEILNIIEGKDLENKKPNIAFKKVF